ncbi:hypothetical protein [Sediminibacterium ginsengisoli]|uniref:Integral membrane protein n=1 Tax=Sediminibacterium ginsengisoli TaxID=413434 RepID=A0A1T4NHD8_9BACT|nr:hypothetical protein [Sediminibacterium ginsengisoli]SJZ78644.1 hypothetical protein SAMN04488132_104260 [Sediminibacterium ginsengisoli]
MNYIIITYVAYLFISIVLTIWVARTLFRNGKIFLVDIFHGNRELADSVNNLLLVGFYLVNIGYAVYILTETDQISSARLLLEVLSRKVGFITLLLGGMHFFNLFIFFKLRKRAQEENTHQLRTLAH